jgi:hypothetical protein
MEILINNEKLKPCPFCGGYVHQDKTVSYFRDYVIYCEGCDMYFALDSFNAEGSDLIEKFNKRAGNGDHPVR